MFVQLSDEDRAEVARFARDLLARKQRYGWLTIAAIVLRLATKGQLVLWLDGTEICSQFVARALEHGGIDWPRDPSQLAPGDLLQIGQLHPQMRAGKCNPAGAKPTTPLDTPRKP